MEAKAVASAAVFLYGVDRLIGEAKFASMVEL